MNNQTKIADASPLVVNTTDDAAPIEWDGQGFSRAPGQGKSKTLLITESAVPGQIWQSKQDNALAEYENTHVQEQLSPALHNIYKLFGAYISAALHGPKEKDAPTILDVGCGIGRMRPLYMRRLTDNAQYLGLDAFEMNMERDYPFICSRLESLAGLESFHSKIDAFIFGTSLDHFEDLDDVAQAVKRLAAPGAVVIFWVGLHDANLVGREEGAEASQRIFEAGGLWASLGRFLRFALWKFPRIAYVLVKQKEKLERGENLDDLHFWYFRERDLPGLLARFGEVTDMTLVPGTNSAFCLCRVEGERG